MSRFTQHPLRPLILAGVLTSLAVGVTACAPPGGSAAPQASSTSDFGAEGPTCGDEDVVLSGYFETGFPLPKDLTAEFTKQYPNVTFDIREDQFAVITQNAPRVLQDSPPTSCVCRRCPSSPPTACSSTRPVRRGLRVDEVARVAAPAAAGR